MREAYENSGVGFAEQDYQKLSLVKILELHVEHENSKAFDELLNRLKFTYGEESGLQLGRYLSLRWDSEGKNCVFRPDTVSFSDLGYDLTLDRLIDTSYRSRRTSDCNETRGSNRSSYWAACLKKIRSDFKKRPPKNQLDEERRAATTAKGFVQRQIGYSRKEALRRSNVFRSRYYWKVKGKAICLWLPMALKGHERRVWLEKHIDNPNPEDPLERTRIQAIIDKNLPKPQFVPIRENALIEMERDPFISNISGEIVRLSLAEAVSEEKAENIGKLRPAIRRLGSQKLKSLIIRIFEDIDSSDYKISDLSEEFQISVSTLSRFAGSLWKKNGSSVPDLWLNTAQLLSTNLVFREVVREAGYLKQVERTLEKAMGSKRGEEE
jgi:hypothetical protein